MNKADEFLNLYSRVEELCEERMGSDNSNKNNVIIRFSQTRQGRRYKADLNLCREVRNILSHHADIAGQPVVEPADALLKTLREVADELSKPALALDFATKAENVVMSNPSRLALPLMRTMEEKGISHIPVWHNGTMIGVFSRGTVFHYYMAHPQPTLTEETEIREFMDYIPFSIHSERYLFAGPKLTYWEAKEAFNQVQKNKRLAAIFITDTGKEKGRLLGMLSPWDVLGAEEKSEE